MLEKQEETEDLEELEDLKDIDDSEEEEEEEVSDEEIEEARRMGWAPKEEWRGDPNVWKDAKTFLRHGQEILPIVRSENRKLREQNEQINSETAKLRSMVKALKKTIEEGSQSNYDEMLSTLKSRRKQALRDEDLATVADLDDQIEHLEERPPAKIKDEEDEKPKVHPDVKAWADETPWYNQDPELTDYMEFQFQKNLHRLGADDVPMLLKRSEEAVKKAFPNKFENPRRKKPNGIESGGGGGGKRDAFSLLPKEAKSAFKSMVEDGTFEDTSEDRAFYAKEYNQE